MTVFLLYIDLCMGSRNRPTKREDPDRTQTVDYLAGLETLPLVSDGGLNLFTSLYTQKKNLLNVKSITIMFFLPFILGRG